MQPCRGDHHGDDQREELDVHRVNYRVSWLRSLGVGLRLATLGTAPGAQSFECRKITSNECGFLITAPAFELPLSPDGRLRCRMFFGIDQFERQA